jgi:hypothetical protein
MDEQINPVEPTKSIEVIKEPKMQNAPTMWSDSKLYNQSLQMAKVLSQSDIVPQQYKGKAGNCLIAIDIGNRIGLSPVVVMQNSQCVNNNFTWKGSACKAMIDACGRYQKTRYVEVGDEGKDNFGVYLEAIDNDGNIVKGVTVTIGMAKAEGWYGRNEKWKNLTSLMLRYRAAAFFMRTECASIAMGFLTKEEVEDIYGKQTIDNQKASVVYMLDEEINGEVVE